MHPGQCFFILEIAQRMPSLFLSFEIKKLLGLEKIFSTWFTLWVWAHNVCSKPYRLILSWGFCSLVFVLTLPAMNWPRFKPRLCPASCQLYSCPGHHRHPAFPLPFFLTNLLPTNCSSHSHDSLSLRSFSSDHSFCPGPVHLEWKNCMLVAVGSLRFVQVYYTDWIVNVQSSMISRGIQSNHIFPEPIIFSLRQELDSLPAGLTFSVKSIFFFLIPPNS